MKPVNRVRFRLNPTNIAVPQGFGDLYLNASGQVVRELPGGEEAIVGGTTDVLAQLQGEAADPTRIGAEYMPDALEFTGADPNIPETVTLTGVFSYDGVTPENSPVVLTRNGLDGGRPKWSGLNEDMVGAVGGWDLEDGGGQIFSGPDANTLSPHATLFGPTSPATGSFAVTTDIPTASFLGQWCAASTAWWQWNGTDWTPIRLLTGEPITWSVAQSAYFSIGVDIGSAIELTAFP